MLSSAVPESPIPLNQGLHLEWAPAKVDAHYLGGQGDLVSKLIMGINGLTTWIIGVINLLT